MKKICFIAAILAFVSLTLYSYAQKEQVVIVDERFFSISSDEFESALFADDSKESIILLDVRTPKEFEEGHIKGAINVDVLDENFLKNAEEALKIKSKSKAPVVAVYCRSGVRSLKAADLLLKNNFASKLYNLKEGIKGWKGEVVK